MEIAWRILTLSELSVLAFCGTLLHLSYRQPLRRAGFGLLWLAALPFAWVTAATFVAIAVNLALQEPLTAGARGFAIATLPAATAAIALVIIVIRRARRT